MVLLIQISVVNSEETNLTIGYWVPDCRYLSVGTQRMKPLCCTTIGPRGLPRTICSAGGVEGGLLGVRGLTTQRLLAWPFTKGRGGCLARSNPNWPDRTTSVRCFFLLQMDSDLEPASPLPLSLPMCILHCIKMSDERMTCLVNDLCRARLSLL